jgi:membrane fusion protein, multidrug efflux system
MLISLNRNPYGNENMKKKLIWILAAVLIVVGLALPKMFGQAKGPAGSGKAEAAVAPKGGKPGGPGGAKGQKVTVSAMVLKPQLLTERTVSPGTVLANEATELKSEIAGKIVSLSIHEGGWVTKGTLLAKINDADLQAQLLKANATLKLAQQREARQKGLLAKEMVTQEDYESASRDLESAQADVALLAAQIQKTEVRAPFDGAIGLRYVSEGAYVSAGTKITTIVSTRPLKIEFSVPEKYAGRVKPGYKVSFAAQGGAKSYDGSVYAVEPSIDEATRTQRMRAYCSNPDNGITPGGFAEVTLALSENDHAILVPSAALVPDATGQNVYRVQGGVASPVRVSTGVRDSTSVQITAGVQSGDTIVTTGVLLLRPGSAVDIKHVE